MAATAFGEEEDHFSKALKCQTWVLKVSIHCQGCKRKVKKVLQGIDGVYTATVDSQQQRVTVTGNIGVETLIKKLIKTGKHAEIWPDKVSSKEKESAKAKATDKQRGNSTEKGTKKTVKFSEEGTGKNTRNVGKSPEKSTNDQELATVRNKDSVSGGAAVDGGGPKSGGKKKKKKGNNGNSSSGSGSPSSGAAAGTGYESNGVNMDHVVGSSNLNPTRQRSVTVPVPQGFIIPPVYASSHSMAYPRGNPGPYYYAPPSPPYADPNRHQVTQLDSFYYFSDENVDGCSIM